MSKKKRNKIKGNDLLIMNQFFLEYARVFRFSLSHLLLHYVTHREKRKSPIH